MGNLKIIDRAKDVGTLLDNTLFAPQFLENKFQSPQLPYGYPASMLLALIPSLWFFVMNKKVIEFSKNFYNTKIPIPIYQTY